MVFTPEELEERRRKREAHAPIAKAMSRRDENDLDMFVSRPLRCAQLFYRSVVDVEMLDHDRHLEYNTRCFYEFLELARSGFEKLVRKMEREVSEVSNG